MQSRHKLIGLASAAILAVPTITHATNGMFLIGVGAKSRSMGGVGIGYTQDAFNNAQNPASITDVGIRLDLDGLFFWPDREVTMPDPRDPPNAGNPVTYVSGSNFFFIPAMAAAYKFNRKVSLGFSFHGSGGGQTRYTRLAPNGENFMNPLGRRDVGDTLGVNLAQAQLAITAAYKINKENSVGASLITGIQTFRAYGLGLFQPFSSDPDNLSNRGNDWAYGAGVRLGWKWKPSERVQFGAAYQSKIYFSQFDKYAGLFADQGTLDTPENFGIGIAVNLTDDLDVAFDVTRVNYSDIKAIGAPIENLSLPGGAGFLGTDQSAGFGWEDQTIYKLGLKYKLNPKWDLQAGVNYGKSPIPKDQMLFSALAPAVTETHLTLGTTYMPNKNMEWSLAYVKALRNSQSGKANSDGLFDFAFPNEAADGPGDMELSMEQDSLSISFSYKM